MDVMSAIQGRRSIRQYSPQPIDNDKVNKVLEAHEQGLGTCWLGRFDEKRVREILEIPDPVRVVAMTPLGVPAERPDPKIRKELADIVSYERY